MVSTMKGLPIDWDVKTKKNVKWVAELGSQSYGNPVVAGGRSTSAPTTSCCAIPRTGGDRGVLMASANPTANSCGSTPTRSWPRAAPTTGRFRASAPRRWSKATGSTTSVNRGVVCVSTSRASGRERRPVRREADGRRRQRHLEVRHDRGSRRLRRTTWRTRSPVSYGDLIFVSTSNGQDESHVHVPSPKAPSIIAVNKKTGKLAWEDNSVEKILHGQWSSPAVGKIGDVVQVMHRRRATAGCAATKPRPARSSGSSTRIPRIRSGRRPATK